MAREERQEHGATNLYIWDNVTQHPQEKKTPKQIMKGTKYIGFTNIDIIYPPYTVYAIIYLRGFYFREFRELGAIREFNITRNINLPRSDPDAKMRLGIRNSST